MNPEDQTLYIQSHEYDRAIGQFKIPELKVEWNFKDLNIAEQLQDIEPYLSKTELSENNECYDEWHM